MNEFAHPAPYPLSTERLSLTDLVTADFVSTYAMDTNEQVMKYIGGAEKRTFDDYYAFITQRLSLWIGAHFHMWAMRLHGGDEFLGWVMIKPIRDTPHVEVGYRMLPSSWGKGYASGVSPLPIGDLIEPMGRAHVPGDAKRHDEGSGFGLAPVHDEAHRLAVGGARSLDDGAGAGLTDARRVEEPAQPGDATERMLNSEPVGLAPAPAGVVASKAFREVGDGGIDGSTQEGFAGAQSRAREGLRSGARQLGREVFGNRSAPFLGVPGRESALTELAAESRRDEKG